MYTGTSSKLHLHGKSLNFTIELQSEKDHIICIVSLYDQEPRWQVGSAYTPADAIAQGLKVISLNDTRVLSRTISNWFDRLKS